MRSRAATLWLGAAAALVAAGPGCGGDAPPSAPAPPPARKADFPKPERGQRIAELRAELGSEGLVLAPSVSVLQSGERNRFGFAVFDAARRQVSDATVALYVAREGTSDVRGPFPASYESLAVEPAFRSAGAEADPDATSSLFVAHLPFERPGRYQVLAAVTLGDRTVPATSAGPIEVTRQSEVPDVGDPAPCVTTPTVESVGGAIEEIDTRVPPEGELHEVDFAEVVGEEPVILLFATPALCQTEVCGPVVDLTLQAKAAHAAEGVEFIHMEIYEDNEFEAGYRPQVRAFDLPSEPWLFAIDDDGKVAARLEGAFGADELERAIDAAASG